MTRRVDLRSDTITQPTPQMREAMATAVVGDDGYGEDPDHQRARACATPQLVGKEAAVFVPSGVMANQIALRCSPNRATSWWPGGTSTWWASRWVRPRATRPSSSPRVDDSTRRRSTCADVLEASSTRRRPPAARRARVASRTRTWPRAACPWDVEELRATRRARRGPAAPSGRRAALQRGRRDGHECGRDAAPATTVMIVSLQGAVRARRLAPRGSGGADGARSRRAQATRAARCARRAFSPRPVWWPSTRWSSD